MVNNIENQATLGLLKYVNCTQWLFFSHFDIINNEMMPSWHIFVEIFSQNEASGANLNREYENLNEVIAKFATHCFFVFL